MKRFGLAIRKLRNLSSVSVAFFTLLALSSCATYYTIHREFNDSFQAGDYEQALRALGEDERRERKRDRFVFFLDRGITHHLLREWSLSNTYLEQAYLFGEDHTKRLLGEVISTLAPKSALYVGEDFEHIIPLYYKALNYVFLGDFEGALVECRRMDLRISLLAQKHRSEKKFRRDAFVHLLMGVIYELHDLPNDAFIAYRNAYEIYTSDYATLFNVSPPQQLIKDMARAAYLSGFMDEYEQIAQSYSSVWTNSDEVYNPRTDKDKGHVVLFWNNGLGPYKSETNLTFVKTAGVGGVMSLTSEEGGVIIPFSHGVARAGDLMGFSSMRISFPKYVERPLYYQDARVWVNGLAYHFELAEDVNAIAFKVLRQRMVYEVTKAVVRTAAKEVVKGSVTRLDSRLALLTDITFLLTEHADTRGWQTSPHAIYYTRLPLDEGTYEMKIELFGRSAAQDKSETFSVQAYPGRTSLYAYSSMQTHTSRQ